MKIYVVKTNYICRTASGRDSVAAIVGIFSTAEKAEKAARKSVLEMLSTKGHSVEENALKTCKYETSFECSLDTGNTSCLSFAYETDLQ